MARRKDTDVAIEEIRQVRRKFSLRLAEARRKGEFLQELRRIGRQGRAFLKSSNGNGRA